MGNIFDPQTQDPTGPADIPSLTGGKTTAVSNKNAESLINMGAGVAEGVAKGYVSSEALKVARKEEEDFITSALIKKPSATEEAAQGTKKVLDGEKPDIIKKKTDELNAETDKDALYVEAGGNKALAELKASARVKHATQVIPGWEQEVQQYVINKMGYDVGGKLMAMAMAHEQANIQKQQGLEADAKAAGILNYTGTPEQNAQLQLFYEEQSQIASVQGKLKNQKLRAEIAKLNMETGKISKEKGNGEIAAANQQAMHISVQAARENAFRQESVIMANLRASIKDGVPTNPAEFELNRRQLFSTVQQTRRDLTRIRETAAQGGVKNEEINQSVNSLDSYLNTVEQQLEAMSETKLIENTIDLTKNQTELSMHRNLSRFSELSIFGRNNLGDSVANEAFVSAASTDALNYHDNRLKQEKAAGRDGSALQSDLDEAAKEYPKPYKTGAANVTRDSVGMQNVLIGNYNKNPDSLSPEQLHEMNDNTMKQMLTTNPAAMRTSQYADMLAAVRGNTPYGKQLIKWLGSDGNYSRFQGDLSLARQVKERELAAQIMPTMQEIGTKLDSAGVSNAFVVGADGSVTSGAHVPTASDAGYKLASKRRVMVDDKKKMGRIASIIDGSTYFDSMLADPDSEFGKRMRLINTVSFLNTVAPEHTTLEGASVPLRFTASGPHGNNKQLARKADGSLAAWHVIDGNLYVHKDGSIAITEGVKAPMQFSKVVAQYPKQVRAPATVMKDGFMWGGVKWNYDESTGDYTR